jgi:hypothetical protein
MCKVDGGRAAPLQCKTATRSFETVTQACISLETKGRMARGGALDVVLSDCKPTMYDCSLLMIWKGVATHSSSKNALVIKVLPDWAEVEYPKVATMPSSKKTLSILAAVSVEALNASSRIAHNNDLISYIRKI